MTGSEVFKHVVCLRLPPQSPPSYRTTKSRGLPTGILRQVRLRAATRTDGPICVVLLTDAILRIHDGTCVRDVPMLAGHSYVRPAGVAHDVMNGDDKPAAFVEIEVKRPDLLVMAK